MARSLSEAAKKRISEAAKARWARFRQAKALGKPMQVRSKPGPKPGRRRGRPVGSKNVKTVAMASMPRSGLEAQSTSELIAMRRRIDQLLADRLVREYVG